MAHLLQRLLRRPSPISLSSFNKHNTHYETFAAGIISHGSQSIDSRLRSILPLPSDESGKAEVKYEYLYPSFSYGLVVNPVFQKVVEDGESGSGEMWADSTKKKRKRKMNKHKYKKLMKRTRNQ